MLMQTEDRDRARWSSAAASPVVSVARRRRLALALLAFPVALALTTGLINAARSQTPLPPATEYLPSISDLMIATIQPRHERLWQAERAQNWEFAAYELGNLHGAFERIGRAHPTVEKISFPEMVASVTEQPFKDLKSAIQAKDDVAFAKAYGDLTEACNSCHQALSHGVVAIGVPDVASSDLKATNPKRP
jgi:hypothetical protein